MAEFFEAARSDQLPPGTGTTVKRRGQGEVKQTAGANFQRRMENESERVEKNIADGAALKKLYSSEPSAKMLAENAQAILVFPNIVRAGFIGAQYGEGVLTKNGQVAGHYNIVCRIIRLPGRRAGVRLRDVLDDRQSARIPGQQRRLGNRCRSDHRCGEKRHGQVAHDDDGQERCLRFYLESEGFDGRRGSSRIEDYEDRRSGTELSRVAGDNVRISTKR